MEYRQVEGPPSRQWLPIDPSWVGEAISDSPAIEFRSARVAATEAIRDHLTEFLKSIDGQAVHFIVENKPDREVVVYRETPWGLWGCSCVVAVDIIVAEGMPAVLRMTALHLSEKLNSITQKDFKS